MEHSDFRIGLEFWCSDRRWRCTDVGQRVIVAIRIDEFTESRMELATRVKTERTLAGSGAEREGWFVAKCVFDEYALEACTLTKEEQ